MPSKAFKLAEAMVSNPVMSDMVENPTATPTQIAAVETKTSAISNTGVISVNTKNIVSNNVLTQSFDSDQVVAFNLTDSIDAVSPIVSVFKEVPQQGFSSKGQWNVNTNATNYDFYDEKPISYASSTLTPSATGDGTFTISPTSTTTYTLQNSSYSTGFSVTSQSSNPRDVAFKNDGTKMYVLHSAKYIYEYSLSTAYDVTTASYVGSINLGPLESAIFDTYGLRFKPDGTKVYVVDYYGKVWQFSLSTAWSISTTTYDSVSITGVVGSDGPPYAFTFKPDGTKLFAVADRRLYEWVLSTAWDLSSASISNQASGKNADYLQFTTYTNTNSHYAFDFAADGTKFVIQAVGSNGSSVGTGLFEVPISSAWDPLNSTSNSLSSDGTLGTDVVRYTGFFDATGGNTVTGFQFINSGNSAAVVVAYNNTGTVYILDTTATQPPFSSTDVGKKVVGNSGSAIITSAAGAYKSVTAFADTSAISSWQLFSAEGKADGTGIQLSGFSNSYGTIYGKNLSDVVNHTTDAFNSVTHLFDFAISGDGTKLFYTHYNDGKIYERAMSTAWDLSTISLTDTISGGHYLSNAPSTNISGFTWSPDGMKLYCIYANTGEIAEFYNDPNYPEYAFRVDTLTYGGSSKTLDTLLAAANTGVIFKNDGTMVFIISNNSAGRAVYSWPLSTAWDLSTAGTRVQSNITFSISTYMMCLAMTADGTSMIVSNQANDNLQHFTLSTPFDITTMTETSQTHDINTVITGSLNSGLKGPWTFQWADNGNRFYVYTVYNGGSLTSTDQKAIYQFSAGTFVHPYSTYSPALTNSINGQINSSAWQDINSMTADETKNDGDIFYAVSTDNRTSWEVAKGSDGVRKIAKNNSGTWQYNNNAGTSSPILTGTVYANKSKDISAEGTQPFGIFIKPDGSKLYVVQSQSTGVRGVFQYTLSTAFDISTASYDNKTFSLVSAMATNNNDPLSSITINSDGSKFYCGSYNGGVMEFTMSTAWDISTGAYNNVLVNPLNALGTELITIGKNDTRIYIGSRRNDRIREYPLSTAGDLSTIGSWLDEVRFDQAPTVEGSTIGVAFNNTGTKLYFAGYGTDAIHQYSLSTPWDLSTINKDGISVSVTSQTTDPVAFCYTDNGTFYVVGFSVPAIYQYTAGTESEYGTSETWVNGTNNNEHATLQQALTSQAFNRMNKAQLDAVADNYHFSQDSADTLDLMIAPYAASGTSPISDGVTINYDAAALVREAIPGTDYIAEFPNNTTINIKSLVNANMKVRAL